MSKTEPNITTTFAVSQLAELHQEIEYKKKELHAKAYLLNKIHRIKQSTIAEALGITQQRVSKWLLEYDTKKREVLT